MQIIGESCRGAYGKQIRMLQGELVSDSQESLILQGTMEGNVFVTWSKTGGKRVDFSIEREFVCRREHR